MSFYDDMAKVAAELLAPDERGGLGTGACVLSRTTPGTPDENQPWLPVEPQTLSETLDGAVFGVTSRMVGTEAGSSVILRSDRYCVCTVPEMGYRAGDTLTVDGKEVTVLSVTPIPAAGVSAAIRFIIR